MNTNFSYVIADHIRSSCFIIADGVLPSPKQRGYVLRRLIRRALLASTKLNIDILNKAYYNDLVASVTKIYEGVYPELSKHSQTIIDVLYTEATKFAKARENGKKEWNKYFGTNSDTAVSALTTKSWDMYQSFGVPFEVSEEQIEHAGYTVDMSQLNALIEEHQQKSAQVSAGQFKSGLIGDTGITRRLHTATHLLHAVLRSIYGEGVKQVGSAITDSKARFDVSIDQDISQENQALISQKLIELIAVNAPVDIKKMTEPEARKLGAIGLFGEKYPEIVTVYTISKEGVVLSREFCGGPHVLNTSEVGAVHITKIKSIGQGRKRFEFIVE